MNLIGFVAADFSLRFESMQPKGCAYQFKFLNE
jgi:hypothetical protein